MNCPTHINWHLVYVDSLFNAEFRNQYVEGSIEYIDDPSLSDNRSVTLGQVRDKDAEEKMGGLLLRQFRRVSFTER